VQVVILGAGIIGVAIADALARGGAVVTVLDRRGPGRGASQASAGILAPYTEASSGSPLLPSGVRSLALFDDFVADAAARSGVRVEYARSGTLEVARDDEAARHLRATRDWLTAIDVAADWIAPADLAGVEPAVAAGTHGALLIRSHGYVGVPSLLRALTQSARLAGAVFESPIEALEITAGPGDLAVRTGARSYAADVVVVAAGSWSSALRIAGRPAWPVRPVRGQLLELEWDADRPLPRHVVWGPGCYCVPWSTRSLLVGATSEDAGFDERSTVEGVAQLTAAVSALIPAARRAAVRDIRVGLRPATPDGLPLIGPLRDLPQIVAATGHFRNGILLAPLTARAVAGYLLNGTRDELFAIATPDRV
jgi:glycine oxidase